MNVNKATLIESMCAKEPALSKAAAGRILTGIFDEITKCIANGDTATIPNFGTFSACDTKERMARNPQTGEQVHVPAGRKAKFTASKKLKEKL